MTYIYMYTHIHILIFMSSTYLNPCLKRENVLIILTVTITLFKKTLHNFTLNHESSQCSSPHPGPWPVGGAHVHAWVLQGNIWDHEVPSPQNLYPLYTNGASIWRRTSEYQSEHATSSHPPPNFTISLGQVRWWWWFLPSLLQDTMGLGFPVAMHSRMAVWWTLMVRFWGPDRMTGSL